MEINELFKPITYLVILIWAGILSYNLIMLWIGYLMNQAVEKNKMEMLKMAQESVENLQKLQAKTEQEVEEHEE